MEEKRLVYKKAHSKEGLVLQVPRVLSRVLIWTNKKSEFVKEFSIKSGERTLSQLAISNLNYIIKSIGEFFYHGFIFPHVFRSQLPSFVSQEVTTTLCMHNIEVFWNSQFLRFNKVPCYSTKHLKQKIIKSTNIDNLQKLRESFWRYKNKLRVNAHHSQCQRASFLKSFFFEQIKILKGIRLNTKKTTNIQLLSK